MASEQKLFDFKSPLLKERLQLEELERVRPEYFDQILAFGKRFVDAADKGLAAVIDTLSQRGSVPLIQWHAIRAFKAAIQKRDIELVQWLVDNGLDLSKEPFKGLLPSLASTEWPNICEFGELLDCLLEGGVDINDTEGETFSTAMHVACARADLKMVQMLASREADINAVNKMRFVPAHVARESGVAGWQEVVSFLVALGAEQVYQAADAWHSPDLPVAVPQERDWRENDSLPVELYGRPEDQISELSTDQPSEAPLEPS